MHLQMAYSKSAPNGKREKRSPGGGHIFIIQR